jgi:hypothetical protein
MVKSLNLKINKGYLQRPSTVRLVAPHESIPNSMFEEYLKNMERVKEYRDSLPDDVNKKKKTKAWKRENGIKELFSLWLNFGDNLSLVRYKLTEDEKELDSESNRLSFASQCLDDAVYRLRQFGLKEVNLMPISEGKSEVSSEELTELKQEVKSLEGDLEYWKNISSILLSLFNKATEDPEGMEVIKPFLSDNGKPTEEYTQIIEALEKIGGE